MATAYSSPRSLGPPAHPSRHPSSTTASSAASVSHSPSPSFSAQRRPSDRPPLASRKSSAVSMRTLTLRGQGQGQGLDRAAAAGAPGSISGQTRDGTAWGGYGGAQGQGYGNGSAYGHAHAYGRGQGYGQDMGGKRMVGSIQLGDGSWEGMDPDEIFRRLTVKEAKKVEAKLRNDAENKQGELRTTVGERYRDLLLSTSQITALRASSLRLSALLGSVADVCANPAGSAGQAMLMGTDGAGGEDSAQLAETEAAAEQDTRDGEDEMVEQLPVAAHMKLLLDAPESLYGFLATESYLEAAYLWLLARMVKESLEALAAQPAPARPMSNGRAFLPLMQKQWEILAPFRTQIIRRATASLAYRPAQSRTRADAKGQGQGHSSHGGGAHERLVDALLAIILLDSNTVLDVLGMFLAERTRSLAAVLRDGRPNERGSTDDASTRGTALSVGDAERPARKSRSEATHSRQRSTKLNAAAMLRGLSPAPQAAAGSDASAALRTHASVLRDAGDARSVRRQRARTTRAFVEMVRCILETLEAVRHLFLPHEEEESGSSPLDDMLHRIQEVPLVPQDWSHSAPNGHAAANGHSGHKRRRSRLASISMPLISPELAPSVRRAYTTGDGSAISGGPYVLAVNSQTILRALPSSQILLSFLPSRIQAFAPFIPASALTGSDQANVILQRLEHWHKTALSQLSVSASTWLVEIRDIKDVCAISAGVTESLEQLKGEMDGSITADEEGRLQGMLQRIWAERMRSIWLDKLAAIERALQGEVDAANQTLMENGGRRALELSPTRMLFSRDLAFPPAPSSTLLISGTSSSAFENVHLPAFRTALRRRRDGRTPLLDQILEKVESISESLLQDLLAIPKDLPGRSSLAGEYESSAEQALERIVLILESQLPSGKGDPAFAIGTTTFLGRLALHLSHGPLASCASFVADSQSGDFRQCLRKLRRQSSELRQSELASRAQDDLLISAPQSPSNAISDRLHVTLLGLTKWLLDDQLVPGGSDKQTAATAIAAFAQGAIHAYQFNASATDRDVLQALAGVEGQSTETAVIAALQRHQVMLNPVLRNLKQRDGAKVDRLSILLPLGTPALATDYTSPLPIAKPAPRFGMLATI